MGNSTGNAQFLQVPQASASTSGTSRLIPQNEPVVQSPQQSPQPSSRRSSKVCIISHTYRVIYHKLIETSFGAERDVPLSLCPGQEQKSLCPETSWDKVSSKFSKKKD